MSVDVRLKSSPSIKIYTIDPQFSMIDKPRKQTVLISFPYKVFIRGQRNHFGLLKQEKNNNQEA